MTKLVLKAGVPPSPQASKWDCVSAGDPDACGPSPQATSQLLGTWEQVLLPGAIHALHSAALHGHQLSGSVPAAASQKHALWNFRRGGRAGLDGGRMPQLSLPAAVLSIFISIALDGRLDPRARGVPDTPLPFPSPGAELTSQERHLMLDMNE